MYGNWISLVAQMVKAFAYNAGDPGLIPGSGRSPGEGNGNPLQYSCLENPMDGGAWWAALQSMRSQRVGHDWATSLSCSFFLSMYGGPSDPKKGNEALLHKWEVSIRCLLLIILDPKLGRGEAMILGWKECSPSHQGFKITKGETTWKDPSILHRAEVLLWEYTQAWRSRRTSRNKGHLNWSPTQLT